MDLIGKIAPSSNAESVVPFKCTYKDCYEAFWSEKALIKHKIVTDDHVYCKLCNVDCEDFEELHNHKVQSTDHICCPACGTDFGSTSGMKRHIRIDHKKPSPVRCVACKTTFSSGGAFVQHFEHDRCRNKDNPAAGVRKEAFEANLERKVQIRDLKNRPDSLGSSTASKDAEMTTATALPRMTVPNYLGDIEETTVTTIPSMSPTTDSTKSSKEEGPLHLTQAEAFRKGIERLNLDHDKDDSNQSFSTLQPSTEKTSWDADQPANTPNIQQQKSQSDNTLPTLNVANYYNEVSGQFSCPFRVCRFKSKNGSELKKHVNRCGYKPKSLQCPGCFHLFKSNHALVQHMSMATERCQIQYSKDFAKVVDHFSGGFLDFKGRDEEGNKVYSAAKPEGFW